MVKLENFPFQTHTKNESGKRMKILQLNMFCKRKNPKMEFIFKNMYAIEWNDFYGFFFGLLALCVWKRANKTIPKWILKAIFNHFHSFPLNAWIPFIIYVRNVCFVYFNSHIYTKILCHRNFNFGVKRFAFELLLLLVFFPFKIFCRNKSDRENTKDRQRKRDR